ncbi:MAG: RNA-binding transcriptional accessory protein, partial [Erysipelotrichales bacterium]|nr:RNA-binding transcriptional accessory protein [Erysipelotrichales bacterium]
MNETIIAALAKKLKIAVSQVENTLSLLEVGNTVPFIARYRKEMTRGLDEEQILEIEKQYTYEVKLAERKEAVLKLIAEQGKLTDEIRDAVNAAEKLSQVEDLYRPYVQKKKTRAATAIKNGLEPLADYLLSLPAEGNLVEEAAKYLNDNVKNVNEAVQGAKDIIAEKVSDEAKLRWEFKKEIEDTGAIVTKLKKDAKDEKKVYEMYYDRSEKIKSLADHRIMAIDRAEKEKVLTVSLSFNEEDMKNRAYRFYAKGARTYVEEVLRDAVNDGCARLLFPSIEREIRSELSE